MADSAIVYVYCVCTLMFIRLHIEVTDHETTSHIEAVACDLADQCRGGSR